MISQAHSNNRATQKDRSAFWVAPPQRYVINRTTRAVIPYNLSVIVAMDSNMVEPSAFLQPIAPFTMEELKGADCAGTDGHSTDAGSPEPTPVPSFFKVQVYVWEDTTLREILEEVLSSSAAARAVLLPVRPAMTPNAESPLERVEGNRAKGGDGGRDHNINQNNGGLYKNNKDENPTKHCTDDMGPNECGEEEDVDEGDDDDEEEEAEENEPLSKRERTEKGEEEKHMERQDAGEALKRRARRKRRPAMPVAKVSVSQVVPDANGKPRIEPMCVLRVDRPIFHTGDLTTIREMRNFRGARAFKNGNLIVIAPTVRHYKPSSSVQVSL